MKTAFRRAPSVAAPDVRIIEHANGQAMPLPIPDADRWRRGRAVANWLRDSALSVAAIVLVLAVAASGWSASFLSLHTFAIVHMGLTERQAWFVPGTFDGAAFGLSLLAFRAAMHGRASLGTRLYVYAFTALSSWINWVHIDDRQGRLVASLLPISAVVMFDKTLREARAAFERRTGRQVFGVRPGLLLLRLLVDRSATWQAIKAQVTAVPVPMLVGLAANVETVFESDFEPDPDPDSNNVEQVEQESGAQPDRTPDPVPDQRTDSNSRPKRRSEAQQLAIARRKFRGQSPTAEGIRKHLNVGLPTARRLRDQLIAEQVD